MANPTFATVDGNSVQYYVAVTISNSESSATASPFQQMVTVDSDSYSSYLASDLSNINFQDGNGNILNSWLESGNSNTSTSTIYWVSLPDGIGASSSVTVYYCIYDTSVNCFNTSNTGEAPQLSPTYGEYDNGANVFLSYFNGTTNTGWTTSGTGTGITTAPTDAPFGSSAFYEDAASGGVNYQYISLSSLTNPANVIINYYIYTTGSAPLGDFFFTESSAGVGTMSRLDGRGGSDYIGFANTLSWTDWNGPNTGVTSSPDTWYLWTIVIDGDQIADYYNTNLTTIGEAGTQINALSSTYSTTAGTITYANNGSYIGLQGDGGSGTTYWQGIIMRAYPPSGTMPSPTFGNFTINTYITYDGESGTYTTQTSIQQPISYNETETEQPIPTKLVAGSLLISINYNDETESYSITPSITQTITYKEYENYKMEAQADITISYSETSSENIQLIYGVPAIVYNNEQEQYSILENNTQGTSTGYLTNNIDVYIPFNATSYTKSIAKYKVNSSYLPPETNVSGVSTSDVLNVNLNFNFTITLSVSSTTVTATIEDLASNPIPNVSVSWTANGGTVSPTTSTTNASGEATTTASASSGVTVTATATILGVTNSASVSA